MTNNQLTSTHLAVKSELDGYKIHASRGQATAMAMVRLFESIDRDLEELQERRQAAMDSEPVELPLDYLQGRKDGLEWAARLAEANHPDTGDWLYDDPIELAKAIRKGPDMPPAQPVADSEPVIVVGDDGGDALSYRRLIQSFEPGTKLYLHAQPAPVVSGWIPVSERLPEEGGRYWCYVEEQNSLGKSHYQWNCSWNGDRWWVESEGGGIVTHWMPLPACPAGGER
ncbi:TPA: DUF551 domain-containing protein [Klebsiella pneumoniae]